MKIIDRHIGRAVLASTALVFTILITLFTFLSLVETLADIGRGDFGLRHAIVYVLLKVPNNAYELFPAVALLGVTLGLSGLAADHELTVLRASGVSLARIVGSVLMSGLLLVALAVTIGEFVAPQTEDWAERGRAAAMHRWVAQQKDYGVWLKDGPAFVHIGEVLPDHTVRTVSLYHLDEASRLTTHLSAATGEFEGGRWRLRDVRISHIEGNRVVTEQTPQTAVETLLTPDMLAVFAVKPEGLSALRLYRYIQHLERNRQDTRRYLLALWQKVMLPLATGVMVVLAIPFVFAPLRAGGVGARLVAGILIGFGFYVLNRGLGYLCLLYGLPPTVGAILPSAMFLAAALLALRRVA